MKSVFAGALCAVLLACVVALFGADALALKPIARSINDAPAWLRYRWFAWGLVWCWHWWLCGRSVQKAVKANQAAYLKDLKDNHATLGHLVNVKYARYHVCREKDLAVSGWVYWGGLCVVAVVGLVLWYLPDWFQAA